MSGMIHELLVQIDEITCQQMSEEWAGRCFSNATGANEKHMVIHVVRSRMVRGDRAPYRFM